MPLHDPAGRLTMITAHSPDTDTGQLVEALRKDGVCVVRGALPADRMAVLAQHFAEFYLPRLLQPGYPYHHWTLDNRRYHNTLEIHLDFNDPALYANPVVLRAAQAMLGRAFVLSSFASAVSYPGAPSQHFHRDQPLLFDDEAIDAGLPPVKLTVCVPLVPVGGEVGSTAFALGSQRVVKARDAGSQLEEAVMSPGDIAIWDSRIFHQGAANVSNVTRPILLLYYQRPWFFDYKNGNRSAITPISRANYARVAPEHRFLFDPLVKYFGYTEFRAGRNDPCPCGGPRRYKHCHGAE